MNSNSSSKNLKLGVALFTKMNGINSSHHPTKKDSENRRVEIV